MGGRRARGAQRHKSRFCGRCALAVPIAARLSSFVMDDTSAQQQSLVRLIIRMPLLYLFTLPRIIRCSIVASETGPQQAFEEIWHRGVVELPRTAIPAQGSVSNLAFCMTIRFRKLRCLVYSTEEEARPSRRRVASRAPD